GSGQRGWCCRRRKPPVVDPRRAGSGAAPPGSPVPSPPRGRTNPPATLPVSTRSVAGGWSAPARTPYPPLSSPPTARWTTLPQSIRPTWRNSISATASARARSRNTGRRSYKFCATWGRLAPMTPKRSGETLFLPGGRGDRPSKLSPDRTLPPHLQEQLPRRLRNIALLYSLAFFLSEFAPSIVAGKLSQEYQALFDWLPGVASILIGIVVAALASSPRVPWQVKMNVGLVFEVLGSYGIARSMYLGAERFASTPIVFFALSPSWVAIWMILYSIVVPAQPVRALFALLASASAPAVVMAYSLHHAGLFHIFTPETFFLTHILPYLTCVLLAYASARIMVTLGAEVSRARELGSYKLIERLGQGGMGEVWRASHQLLAREAAIKFIRPESTLGLSAEASRTMVQRFELEAKSTASLTSAHTVELYDFGVSDDGSFYYIMELLQGLDCDRLVRRFGALPPSRVVHLMAQACESLEEAHRKGLIHRDVKPANIYVCRSGVLCDFVKILDFGLVADRREKPTDVMLTPAEHAIGTPAFMAPEAAQ